MGIISGSGSFRGQFGDHFRVGDHFGVGIISGAVQYLFSSDTFRSLALRFSPHKKTLEIKSRLCFQTIVKTRSKI